MGVLSSTRPSSTIIRLPHQASGIIKAKGEGAGEEMVAFNDNG
jgi:hypothetical protein